MIPQKSHSADQNSRGRSQDQACHAAYGAPAYGAPAYGAPAYGAPAYGAPAYGAPARGAMCAAVSPVGSPSEPPPDKLAAAAEQNRPMAVFRLASASGVHSGNSLALSVIRR